MGPETQIGDTVRYVPSKHDEDIAGFGNNKNPVGILNPEHHYVVEKVEVHSWHTKLWLEGVGGPFNSVHFEKVD
jgi:hypothetical protein